MGKDTLELTDTQRTKNQDRRPNARLPQDDPLLDISARQHGRPGPFKRKANLRRAVSIGIRLDDRDYRRRRRAGLDEALDGGKV